MSKVFFWEKILFLRIKKIKKELYLISSAQLLKLDLKLNLTTSTNYRLHQSSLNPLWVKYLNSSFTAYYVSNFMLNRKMLKVGETTDRILLFSKLSQETNHHHHCDIARLLFFGKTCWVDTTLGSPNWTVSTECYTVHVIPSSRIIQILDWGDRRPPIFIGDPILFILEDLQVFIGGPKLFYGRLPNSYLEIPSFFIGDLLVFQRKY